MYVIRRGVRAPSELHYALLKIASFNSSSLVGAAVENSEDSRQIRKRLRKQRRAAAAHLKNWTEESFGTAPQYFSDIAPRNATSKSSESSTEKEEGEEEDEDEDAAMWRQVLSQCRSKKERARVHRVWKMWIEHKAASSSSSSQNEENESMRSQKTSSSGGGFDFQSHFSDQDHYHYQQSWQDEYETFWTFNPSSTESKQREQKQREQAGNSHPGWRNNSNYNWFNFSSMNTKQPLQPQLSNSARESLTLLGLENSNDVLPTMATLKSAFRKMALQHHPDRCLDASAKSAAEKRFKELQAAFQLIQTMVT